MRRSQIGESGVLVKIQVLIVDDSPVARHGLTSILRHYPDVEVVGEASGAAEAFTEVPRLKPDIVIMNAQMPEMDGAEATGVIKERWPWTKVLFLAVHVCYFEVAAAAGADGCLMKDGGRHELVEAIRELGRRN